MCELSSVNALRFRVILEELIDRIVLLGLVRTAEQKSRFPLVSLDCSFCL